MPSQNQPSSARSDSVLYPHSPVDSRFCNRPLKHWALGISVVQMLTLLAVMAVGISMYKTESDTGTVTDSTFAWLIIGGIGLTTGIVICLLIIYGLTRNMAWTLVPHIIIQLLIVLGSVIGSVAYAFRDFSFASTPFESISPDVPSDAGVEQKPLSDYIIGAALLLLSVIEMVWIYIMIRAYNYFTFIDGRNIV